VSDLSITPPAGPIVAVVSMLHESADANSATRRFRGQPVLDWTLRRLAAAGRVTTSVVMCWDDQADAVEAVPAVAKRSGAAVLARGGRTSVPTLAAIAAARRWADGWRGGLLGTCDFDLGYHAAWTHELAELHDAAGVLLVDPAAALVDPALIDAVVAHATAEPTAELCFMPAAPGLSATLLRRTLVARLATADTAPGRLLTYWPDSHGVDPIGRNGCVPVPTPVARTTYSFKLDTDRQVQRAMLAMVHLNGHLATTEAEQLVHHMRGAERADALPRDVVLELNTTRDTRPSYWPGRSIGITRPDLTLATARRLIAELAVADDVRLTLAGVGDPLRSPIWPDVVAAAVAAGLAVHVETDLVSATPDDVQRLVDSGIDVVTVHLPAITGRTYADVMGVDAAADVVGNLRRLHAAARGTPLVVPTFTKTASNLAEMEAWYDYWHRQVGHAVIVGPSTFAGRAPDVGVADMTPPKRRPCARIASRLTVLSDGTVVSCEQDVTGQQPMGRVGEQPLADIWRQSFASLRSCHAAGRWDEQPLCGGCREWHRP
jgi:MoaA/NifB/PqqE/SkfB family radical SAM enzyme/2-C-methyl-D-erythritol 4-phosphate cytidylyltransferase